MARIRLRPGEWGDVQLHTLPDDRVRARVNYCNASGEIKRVQRVATTKTAAKRAVLEAVKDAASQGVGRDGATVTIKELVGDYLAWGRAHKWRPQTADQYDQAAKHDIYPTMGNLRVIDGTTSIFEGHLQAIRSPAGLRTARIVLRGAYNHGIKAGVAERNPIEGTTPAPVTRARPVALTPADFETVRAAIKAWQEKKRPGRHVRSPYLLNFLDVLIGSGARPNEVLALTWPCVDVATNQITIQATLARHKDGDGNSRLWMQDTPKTSRGHRIITLPDWAMQAIELQQLDPYACNGGELTTPQGLVFPNSVGGLMDLANVRRTLREALKDTGVDFHPYLTRSTALTAISEVYGLIAARDVAGHTSTAITEAHYVQRARVASDVSGALGDYRPSG